MDASDEQHGENSTCAMTQQVQRMMAANAMEADAYARLIRVLDGDHPVVGGVAEGVPSLSGYAGVHDEGLTTVNFTGLCRQLLGYNRRGGPVPLWLLTACSNLDIVREEGAANKCTLPHSGPRLRALAAAALRRMQQPHADNPEPIATRVAPKRKRKPV